MEWVETTGRSVQEAKEAALDELGVDEVDAEFEVIAEAQLGLFGRLRSEARVRARVRPTAPRAKEDRRDRRERRRRSGGAGAASAGAESSSAESSGAESSGAESSGADGESTSAEEDETGEPTAVGAGPGSDKPRRSTAATADESTADESTADDSTADESAAAAGAVGSSAGAGGSSTGPRKRNRNRRRGTSRPGGGGPSEARWADLEQGDGETDEDDAGKGPDVEVALEEQAEVGTDFLKRLVAEFGLDAQVDVAHPDEDTVELQLSGPDLGILIGPKGATLLAIQNLTRTVVFNETGANNGHINVDIGGYRQKRTEALVRFANQVADRVKETGARTVLEPMSSIDRKVVHDTISGIEGVSTISEGEEPRRRVVVLPG